MELLLNCSELTALPVESIRTHNLVYLKTMSDAQICLFNSYTLQSMAAKCVQKFPTRS